MKINLARALLATMGMDCLRSHSLCVTCLRGLDVGTGATDSRTRAHQHRIAAGYGERFANQAWHSRSQDQPASGRRCGPRKMDVTPKVSSGWLTWRRERYELKVEKEGFQILDLQSLPINGPETRDLALESIVGETLADQRSIWSSWRCARHPRRHQLATLDHIPGCELRKPVPLRGRWELLPSNCLRTRRIL